MIKKKCLLDRETVLWSGELNTDILLGIIKIDVLLVVVNSDSLFLK